MITLCRSLIRRQQVVVHNTVVAVRTIEFIVAIQQQQQQPTTNTSSSSSSYRAAFSSSTGTRRRSYNTDRKKTSWTGSANTRLRTTHPPLRVVGSMLLPVLRFPYLPYRLHAQAQQMRYFGKGLQPHRHGKKYGYTNDEMKLQICYSDYDLQLDEEDDTFDEETQDMTFCKVKFSLSEIKDTVGEVFDDIRQLQYYDIPYTTPTNTGAIKLSSGKSKHIKVTIDKSIKPQWRPLKDLNTENMQIYRGGKKVLKVRVPDYYDDTPMYVDNENNINEDDEEDGSDADDDNDEEKYYYDEDEDGNTIVKRKKRKGAILSHHTKLDNDVLYLEFTIKGLVTKLKDNNYVRADGIIYGENNYQQIVYTMLQKDTNHKVYTRDYILKEASQNKNLARLLLSQPNALDHITKAIHYNILWEFIPAPKRLHNGYYQKQK